MEPTSAQLERLERLREAGVVLVSACLLGVPCRYDGCGKRSEAALLALEGKAVVPVCPEAGVGLGIPRPPVELSGGTGASVLRGEATARIKGTGEDRTAAFREGAQMAVDAARRFGATVALLKERSPSCGARQAWCDGVVVTGQGVAAAALAAAGVTLVSDEDLL